MRTARSLLLGGGLLLSGAASAGLLEGEPFAWYLIERDSNLFRADEDIGEASEAETIHRYGVGAALQYSFGLQRVYAGGEVRRNEYADHGNLDHEGHELRAGMDWQLGHAASGALRASQEKRIESFADRDDDALSLQTERRGSASGTLAITPRWAVQGRVDKSRLRSALQRSRNYDRDETGHGIAALYTGSAAGTAGLQFEWLEGRFPNREPADGVTDRYDERSLELSLGWQPSGLSRLELEAGLTERDNRGGEDFSGFTGRLHYERRLSGKTVARAELFRQIVSVEEVDANFVAQTGASARIDWQVLRKLYLFGSYEFRNDDYEGSPAFDLGDDPRRDEIGRAELGARYTPVFWFNVSPAAVYERRDSSRDGRSYDTTILKLDLEARYD